MGVPSAANTPIIASDGPVDRYTQDKSFPGKPTGANPPRKKLPTNKEIEMIVTEKGRTHRLRGRQSSNPVDQLGSSAAKTKRPAITHATGNQTSFRTLNWHWPADKPLAERESILRILGLGASANHEPR